MRAIFKSWVWKMAARDARYGVRKLVLSMSCVVLGAASYVAVASFSKNLEVAVEEQSKSLLGADLAIQSRQPFSREAESLLRSLGGRQSRQINFSSMAYFPDTGKTRLVQVRALQGAFPYYGFLETEPASAGRTFQSGPNALVDETLMIQFGAGVGDRIRIGDTDFRIAGKLRRIPGESVAFSVISPRVYVPLAYLDQTGLIQRGSIVRYRVYFKLDPAIDPDRIAREQESRFTRLGLEPDTVSRRKAAIGRATENLSRFLHLAGFVAVLLAGIGVASGVHVYTKEKISTIAVLRCIGAGPQETVATYLIQALAIGLSGSLLGALLGLVLQTWIPAALKDFLPFSLPSSFAPMGIVGGLVIGTGTALLFSLLPLLPLRRISPLLALRFSFEPFHGKQDPLVWVNLLLIVAGIASFAVARAERWYHALWFTLAVLGAFGVLFLLARGISAVVKKLLPDSWPYPWRQGLANLYRPNNQTTTVMLALGLGTCLLVTLYLTQKMLLEQVALQGGRNNPNVVLFDVQKDQKEEVSRLLQSFHLPRFEEVPVVTMRLASIKGRSVEEIRKDPGSAIPAWALRREYRSTYRSRLAATERILAGTWRGKTDPASETIPISIEKGIAETLGVTVGDGLVFDIQGVRLTARVASIREVDWHRVQPNFFVVFPEGALEHAPQFYALVTRADTSELSARLQRAVVEKFPNVSIIDLSLVLATVDAVLSRISQAIRWMAFFTILTGLMVLAGAVLSSRSQRVRESILLKTLGARRSQITKIIVAEYFLLGAISGLAGVILAIAASWGLTFYFLGTASSVPLGPVLTAVAVVASLTVVAGLLSCYGILGRPALEALRAES
ncbi:MAG: ABC transporter permease [Deltaproteobacteria bacterium]|nr:ABC transporter permease [Deltaproteobacteria bacterium]